MNAKKVVTDDEGRAFIDRILDASSLTKHYRLTPTHEVEECSMSQWVHMFEDAAGRTVAKTVVDGARVSTVFLGLDHGWGGPVPILFETMVFPDPESGVESDMDRYATWDEAVAGHEAMVAKVRGKVVQFRRRK